MSLSRAGGGPSGLAAGRSRGKSLPRQGKLPKMKKFCHVCGSASHLAMDCRKRLAKGQLAAGSRPRPHQVSERRGYTDAVQDSPRVVGGR